MIFWKRMNKKYTVRFLFAFSFVILFLCLPGPVQSKEEIQSAEAQAYLISQKEHIKIDGHLTEELWQKAIPIGPLTMVEPDEGLPSTMKTEVRVAVDSHAIYFGIMCFDSEPDRIVSYTMQRDAQLRGEDHIKIVLDTFLSARTGYIFAINPNGARYDGLIENEGEGENSQWDGIWEAAARRFEQGWSAEIFIPIKTIRFASGLTQWGFNVERRIQRLQETDRWVAPNRNFKVTNVSTAGKLTSIPAFQQGKGLTIRPYVLGNRIQDATEGSASTNIEPGLDIMKNFGGNVTGLLSINTDFAETEVDTRRINLTRFPLFFPEKRTFFLEGSDIFEFGLGMGFHHSKDLVPFFSRRIGLIEGETVPLDVALKATGRIGRFSFGVLDSLMQPVDGLSPRVNLFAARGFQSIGEESKLGFLVTAGDPLGSNNSWQTGVDFVYKTSRFKGNKSFLVGIWGLFNNLEDAGNDRTALGFIIDYPNDLWDISLNFKRIGEDYNPSMGFVPWRGIYKANFNLVYKPRPEWSLVRQMMHEFFTQAVWDLDGHVYQWRIFTAPINWRLESGDRIEFNIVPNYERIPEDFEIAENVFVKAGNYTWWRYRLEFQSASKRKVMTQVSWWFGTLYDGNMDQFQVQLGWRPSHHLNLAFEGERNSGSLKGGDVDIKLARARIDLFFTPDLQILSFFQYDNITNSLGMNSRLRFTLRSLLDIFIVYNRNWLDTQGRFLSELNQFFIKIQYSWR